MFLTTDPKRKYLIIALAALIFILSITLLYMQYSAWQNLQARVEEEEMALLEAQAHLNRLFQHRENAEQYERRLATARRLMPADPQEQDLIRYLSRLAEVNDLYAANIRLGNHSTGEEYSVMPFDMSLEGSYRNLGRFLESLRNGERAVRVDNLRLSRGGPAEATTNITLSAAAFYYSRE